MHIIVAVVDKYVAHANLDATFSVNLNTEDMICWFHSSKFQVVFS